MTYDAEKVKLWINNILDVLAQVADLEFQRKAWLEGRSFLSVSLAETSCQLYDDSAFRSFLENCRQEKWLPENILIKLEHFNVGFEKYLYSHGTHHFVEEDMQSDPKWHEVQNIAKELLNDFKALGFNPPDLSKLNYLKPPEQME